MIIIITYMSIMGTSLQVLRTRVLTICFLLFFALCSSDEAGIVTVDVHAANHLISSGHRFIDVRTEEEFKRGHVDVQNCLNIPYMFTTPQGRVKNPTFLEQVSSVCKKEDHLVVGCQSGVRSVYATKDLLEAGFKHVSNMGGGYIAWAEKGLSVKKPEAEL